MQRLGIGMAAVRDRLEVDRLRLHPHKAHISCVADGLNLLGYVVFPTQRRLRNDNGHRFARKLRRMARAFGAGRLEWANAAYASAVDAKDAADPVPAVFWVALLVFAGVSLTFIILLAFGFAVGQLTTQQLRDNYAADTKAKAAELSQVLRERNIITASSAPNSLLAPLLRSVNGTADVILIPEIAYDIEPIAAADSVFISAEAAYALAANGQDRFCADYLGTLPLAKGYGSQPMYRLRRASDMC